MTTEDLLGREHEIADALRNTDQPMEDLLTEDEKKDYKFIAAVNTIVMRCSTCNHWVDVSETNDDGDCIDCQIDNGTIG